MKKSGRKSKYTASEICKAVEMYLSTNMTAEEVATEFGMPASTVRYHVVKRRKEKEQVV